MSQRFLQIGTFPKEAQLLINKRFSPVQWGDIQHDPRAKAEIQCILTRSNFDIGADLITQLPQLQLIAISGVGYEKVCLTTTTAKNILVTHTPNVLDTTVAELCIGALLALLRHIPQADQFVRQAQWPQQFQFTLGTNLKDKRVGIVGMGRIGTEIARLLKPFNVKIHYHSRSAKQVPYHYHAELLDLAKTVDILITITPGGPETTHLINQSVFDALGAEGYFLNFSRGSVVDEEALIHSLSKNIIKAAALDVYNNEPNIDPRFYELHNTILLPHIGSGTVETRLEMLELMMNNVDQFLKNGSVLTPIPSPA